MNIKSVEIFPYLHPIRRISGIMLWGIATFLLLWSPDASASNPKHLEHDSLVLMSPKDLSVDMTTSGDDIYLYEQNAKTYLYVEQDSGKRLLVLDVTNPQEIKRVATVSMAVGEAYDFVRPLGTDSVLVRFHGEDSAGSRWGRLELRKPMSPGLSTWQQDSGDILDAVNNQMIDAGWVKEDRSASTHPYSVVDTSYDEPRLLGTIPGVRKTLSDEGRGHKFYLASDGVWILRNLVAERAYVSESNPAN